MLDNTKRAIAAGAQALMATYVGYGSLQPLAESTGANPWLLRGIGAVLRGRVPAAGARAMRSAVMPPWLRFRSTRRQPAAASWPWRSMAGDTVNGTDSEGKVF
ncbi:hypothetical protein GCM10007170_45330 [Arthrobacter liuii]|uniref:Uncharacterized protein n=1 Tax=Arthrobacter liuii TaxID=1476996 RepID=A0ABQ2AZ28_9MICC|nr:hypothetical protein GCM10007170_45330 [Arthrobacter liuii]